jgi:regulator of sirC expression with transglutaminase-like and TPR domain
MPPGMLDARWSRIAAGDSGLAEGALLIAAEEYPRLEVDRFLERLDEMGRTLARRLRPDIGTGEAVVALNRYLFQELGFRGNAADYYDPRNSFLNEVIDRRLGVPITLSVLYIEIGRRIGLPLEGVAFPGHFLVRCALRDGTVILDPYARGTSLKSAELRERLQRAGGAAAHVPAPLATALAPAMPREIFARMLRNLRAVYAQRGELIKALAACWIRSTCAEPARSWSQPRSASLQHRLGR